MEPDFVVLPEPDIDGDLRFFRSVEPFCSQDFSAECSVEAFVVSVLLGPAREDPHPLDADPSQPILKSRSNELLAIV